MAENVSQEVVSLLRPILKKYPEYETKLIVAARLIPGYDNRFYQVTLLGFPGKDKIKKIFVDIQRQEAGTNR